MMELLAQSNATGFPFKGGELIAIVAVTMGGVVGFFAVVGGIIQNILATREKERSRREIAAYVAEGTITPDDGARLMEAGQSVLTSTLRTMGLGKK